VELPHLRVHSESRGGGRSDGAHGLSPLMLD
jgi:hypothetical protein